MYAHKVYLLEMNQQIKTVIILAYYPFAQAATPGVNAQGHGDAQSDGPATPDGVAEEHRGQHHGSTSHVGRLQGAIGNIFRNMENIWTHMEQI